MADASAQPQVVANIAFNQWAMNHCDLSVTNTGNATAFDILVEFDPPLEVDDEGLPDPETPLHRISLLKPGQSLSSYLNESIQLIDVSYKVTISWRLKPDSAERQSLSYSFNMNDYKGITTLGATNPSVQIAEQIKKLREDWRYVANGQRKIKADTYALVDRERNRKIMEERYQKQQAASVSSPVAAQLPKRRGPKKKTDV